jgi:hypothetical protein
MVRSLPNFLTAKSLTISSEILYYPSSTPPWLAPTCQISPTASLLHPAFSGSRTSPAHPTSMAQPQPKIRTVTISPALWPSVSSCSVNGMDKCNSTSFPISRLHSQSLVGCIRKRWFRTCGSLMVRNRPCRQLANASIGKTPRKESGLSPIRSVEYHLSRPDAVGALKPCAAQHGGEKTGMLAVLLKVKVGATTPSCPGPGRKLGPAGAGCRIEFRSGLRLLPYMDPKRNGKCEPVLRPNCFLQLRP